MTAPVASVTTEQEVSDFRHEVTGEWLELLFPLTESAAVVALAEDAKINDRPANDLRREIGNGTDRVLGERIFREDGLCFIRFKNTNGILVNGENDVDRDAVQRYSLF